jgi:hypothetical protein
MRASDMAPKEPAALAATSTVRLMVISIFPVFHHDRPAQSLVPLNGRTI